VAVIEEERPKSESKGESDEIAKGNKEGRMERKLLNEDDTVLVSEGVNEGLVHEVHPSSRLTQLESGSVK